MIGCNNGISSFNKICRLCMRQEGAMSPIFTDDAEGIIPYRILYCLSLKVLIDDDLPMLICAQCIHQLNCSFKFKTQCENSDAELRKYLRNLQLNTEIKQEFEDKNTRYDNVLSCHVQENRNEDYVGPHRVVTANQLSVGTKQNCDQQQVNIKLENTESTDANVQYPEDSPWNCEESANFELSDDVNQYERSNELERQFERNIVSSSINITSTENPYQKRNLGNVSSVSSPGGISASVFNISESTRGYHKELQAKAKMKDRKMLKSNFRTENIIREVLTTSETNQNARKPYTCQWCFQSYAGRSGLWQHLQKHSGRQYVCKVCNKHFTRGNILKQHERTHSGNLSGITCPTCKKTFVNLMQLKRHEIGHLIDWSNGKMCT